MARDAEQSDTEPAKTAPSYAAPSASVVPNAEPSGDALDQARRGRQPKPAIEPSDIQGLKYFDKLKPLLARLHEVGTKRDKAHNRDLHMVNTVC